MENEKQKKYAILIGVDKYLHNNDFPDLRNPINDVNEFERILKKCEGCDFEIKVLKNPNNQDLRTSLADILSNTVKNNDMVLIYFSGHGKLSPEGDLCLCTNDSKASLLDTTAIDLPWLNKKIKSTRASQIVLLLDCCYSGAAIGSFKGSVSDIIKSGIGGGNGKFLITSSSGMQASLELATDDTSLFTKWLLQGLESWEADTNDDGIITIEELFNYAKTKTINEVTTQTPQRFVFGSTPSEIYIARKKDKTGPAKPIKSSNLDHISTVSRLLKGGKIIPILGEGIFTTGQLSTFALINSLSEIPDIKLNDQSSCTTVAEFVQQHMEDRDDFISLFKDLVQNQQDEIDYKTIHKKIAEISELRFIISTTYDTKFEDYLIERGRPFVVISHILYSENNEHDGRILVLRIKGKENITAEVYLADELITEKDELIIYKLLGSPFLERYYKKTDCKIDTVIITESDHTKFLAFLENQHTKVPEAFSPYFKKYPLLFLGYNLDTWHYRLVLKALTNTSRSVKRPYAIREPTSVIEELFWERLGTRLIRSDIDSIANAHF